MKHGRGYSFIELIDLIRLPFICSLNWTFIIILQVDGFSAKDVKDAKWCSVVGTLDDGIDELDNG